MAEGKEQQGEGVKAKVEEKPKATAAGAVKPVPKAPPPDPEGEAIRKMARSWNVIVNSLMTAEKSWNEILAMQEVVSKQKLMFAPMEVQKALSRFGKAQFNVMLARFVDYYRAQGGLEAMKVKEVK